MRKPFCVEMKRLVLTAAAFLILSFVFFCPGARAGDAEGTSVNPEAYGHLLRVACVGDSITQGVGISEPGRNGYPAQLQTMLGAKCEVKNFGVGGRTMLRKADTYDIGPALSYKPDVVIIMLGTNDSKINIWSAHKDEFIGDYLGVIKAFSDLESHPKIYLCLPPPCFPGDWGITETAIANEVIPAIKKAAETANLPVIDLHTPLKDAKELFPDRVHPNKEGARIISENVVKALKGN